MATFPPEIQNELTVFRDDIFSSIHLGKMSREKLLSVLRSAKKFYGVSYGKVPFDTVRSLISETLLVSVKFLDAQYETALREQFTEQIGVTNLLRYHIERLHNAKTQTEYTNILADMKSDITAHDHLKYINDQNTFLKHCADIDAKMKEETETKLKEEQNAQFLQENEHLKQELAQRDEKLVKLQQQLDSLKNSIACLCGSASQ